MNMNGIRQALYREFLAFDQSGGTKSIAGLVEQYKCGQTLKPEFYGIMPVTAAFVSIVPVLGDEITEFSLHFRINYQYAQDDPEAEGNNVPCLVDHWRSVAAVKFNLGENALKGCVFEIAEFAATRDYAPWAAQQLSVVKWECLLLHILTDFARAHNIKELSITPEYGEIAVANGFTVERYVKEVA